MSVSDKDSIEESIHLSIGFCLLLRKQGEFITGLCGLENRIVRDIEVVIRYGWQWPYGSASSSGAFQTEIHLLQPMNLVAHGCFDLHSICKNLFGLVLKRFT